jgi:hypothetical protein
VKGILADANVEGHVRIVHALLRSSWRAEVWAHLNLTCEFFPDIDLDRTTPDLEVWQKCQELQLALVTANRNEKGSESLGAAIQALNEPTSLPVFTIGDSDRVLSDPRYAERVADRLLDYAFDIERYKGTGRLYLP